MLNLSSLFPIYCNNEAIGHIFLSLCGQWRGPELRARMVVPFCDPLCRGPNLVEGIPPLLKRLYGRNAKASRAMAERRFLRDIKDFDVAYLWPGISSETFRRAKQSGRTIFMERINCYPGTAKRILDDAYERLGLHPQHPITSDGIEREEAEAELTDFIFCPSPEVKKSFQEAGVPEQKLVSTSYGWSQQRFPTIPSEKLLQETVTVLFVGRVCVRKGAHLLLRAWERASVKGRLMLCGGLEPAIAETCGELLARSDVVHLEYNKDIASAYLKADIFAFPTLEEGSPLVIYEAMANGLSILTSPMGAGSVIRDGIDGTIIPPYENDAWVEALRQLVYSPELRIRFSTAARQRAEEFTWERVAARRAALIIERLNA